MGFSEQRARKALVLCRDHAPAAMEWLLEVPEEQAEAPLTEADLQRAGLAGPRRSRRAPRLQSAPPSANPTPTRTHLSSARTRLQSWREGLGRARQKTTA